jgi:hypothetical protein
MTAIGTFETCQQTLSMTVYGGSPEVAIADTLVSYAGPPVSICGRRKRTHDHSGSPALQRPLTKMARSFSRRNGAKSLRLEARKLGLNSSARAMAFCAGSSRPASALLAAHMQIVSRKSGLFRIDFSAHDDAMS